MWKLRLFFKSMFSELGSGMSGPASVPFALLALFAPNSVQKTGYAVLALLLAGFSAYRIWLHEHNRAEAAEKKIDQLRPSITFRTTNERMGRWGLMDPGDIFTLTHLGGEAAQYVQVEPIESAHGKKLCVAFNQIDLLDNTIREAHPRYDIYIAGCKWDKDKVGNMGYLLFKQDAEAMSLSTVNYPILIRFRWKKQRCEAKLTLVYDALTETLFTMPPE